MGAALLADGKAADAEPHLRRAYDLRLQQGPENTDGIDRAAQVLAGCLSALGRHDEARRLCRDSVGLAQTSLGHRITTVVAPPG